MEVHKAYWWKYGGIILVVFWLIVLFLFSSCTLKPPEKTIALNLVAKNSGFLLAQENLPLALEIHKYSNALLDTVRDTEILPDPDFTKWVEWMIGRLDLDPFLQMNFQELIKLVDIEIELSDSDEELVELLYQVIRSFVIGIEAGKR